MVVVGTVMLLMMVVVGPILMSVWCSSACHVLLASHGLYIYLLPMRW